MVQIPNTLHSGESVRLTALSYCKPVATYIANEVFFLYPSLTRLNEFRLNLVLASINFLL